MGKRIALVCFVVTCIIAPSARAQDTRIQVIEQQIAEKARNLQPPQREKGDQWITRFEKTFTPVPPGIRPSFGNFRQDAGFAGGAAFDMPLMKTGLWTTQGAWSVNNFKQGQSTMQFPSLLAGRLHVAADGQWNDAPDLRFFGLGNNSAHGNQTSYKLQWVNAGIDVDASTPRWLRLAAGAGYLGAHSENDNRLVFVSQNVPGTEARLKWIDVKASAAIDTRESPGYSRRGGYYGAAFHRYQDPDGNSSFDRTELDVRQFIPILHENWIVALQGRAELTKVAPSQTLPYFMLPYIGGRDSLPGFEAYRFADKDSLLFRSELRWPVSPLLDMAVFYGKGKVAGKVDDLDLHHLHSNIGFGARFHGPVFTALRLEVAHGSEGWHFIAAQSISF
jgi:hypothetical protein